MLGPAVAADADGVSVDSRFSLCLSAPLLSDVPAALSSPALASAEYGRGLLVSAGARDQAGTLHGPGAVS